MLEYVRLPGALTEIEWMSATPDQVVAIKVNRYVLAEEHVVGVQSSESLRDALLATGVGEGDATELAHQLWTRAVRLRDQYKSA